MADVLLGCFPDTGYLNYQDLGLSAQQLCFNENQLIVAVIVSLTICGLIFAAGFTFYQYCKGFLNKEEDIAFEQIPELEYV